MYEKYFTKKELKSFMVQQVKVKEKIQRNFENEGWFYKKKNIYINRLVNERK